MQDGAINAAAVELLTLIVSSPKYPAAEIINGYVRARRYIGSKDRRLLTDRVWHVLRHLARLEFLKPGAGWAEKLSMLAAGPDFSQNMPFHVRVETPKWLIPLFRNAEAELPKLLEPPHIVLRVVGDREAVRQQLADSNIETDVTPFSPIGLILKKRINLAVNPLFRKGIVEVQDEGSQLMALETGISARDTVLDYCAGAGGKTLIFAEMMERKGILVAHDIFPKRLKEMTRRASRAGLTHIQTASYEELCRSKPFSHVVVDVPCSGTGTWRRCPEARWRLTPEKLKNILKTQQEILDKVVPFVSAGGTLSYITCSLLTCENEEQVAHFLKKHPDFSLVRQKICSPALTDTDGFFIAVFRKNQSFPNE